MQLINKTINFKSYFKIQFIYVMAKPNFQQSLLLSLVLHDLSEISL